MKKNLLLLLIAISSFIIITAANASELLVRVSNIDSKSYSPLGFMIVDAARQKVCYNSDWLKPGDSVAVTIDKIRKECRNESEFVIVAENQGAMGNDVKIHQGQTCAMMYWPDGKYIECW